MEEFNARHKPVERGPEPWGAVPRRFAEEVKLTTDKQGAAMDGMVHIRHAPPETLADWQWKLRAANCEAELPDPISGAVIEVFLVPSDVDLRRTVKETLAFQDRQDKQCESLGIAPNRVPVQATAKGVKVIFRARPVYFLWRISTKI